jgi:hypothetical protein
VWMDAARRFEYVANSMYAFRVGLDSYHGFQGGHHIGCVCIHTHNTHTHTHTTHAHAHTHARTHTHTLNLIYACRVGLDHDCHVTHAHTQTHTHNTSAGEPRDSIIVIFYRSHEQVLYVHVSTCLREHVCVCVRVVCVCVIRT